VAKPADAGEIVKRALAYPYAVPDCSFVYECGGAHELPPQGVDLSGREPLLAYGANAAPEALAWKLAALPELELPVIRAELEGFDVVYSAHISRYGAVPATLEPSPGTTVATFVAYPTAEQLELIAATERLNYELSRLSGISCRLEVGKPLSELDAFLSVRGCLRISGSEVALAAIGAVARGFDEMDEPGVLEHARARLAPELDLEAFVLRCVEQGGVRPLPAL